jgi:hypothetical protein
MKPTLALAAAAAVALAAPAFGQGLSDLPLVSEVAPGAVAISPHVPQMGAHYADPATLPLGPIYCVIEGRVVCVEYMFTADDLAAGRDWRSIPTGMETPPITRIDMEYRPQGAGPFAQPLYQLHLYFASAEVLAAH